MKMAGRKIMFECDLCHKKLKSRATFIKHWKHLHHHQSNVKNAYQCLFCDLSLKTKHQRRYHMKKEHDWAPRRKHTEPDIVCSRCECKFFLRKTYLMHLRRKHGVFSYNDCSYCEEKFFQRGSRNYHERVKHKRRLFTKTGEGNTSALVIPPVVDEDELKKTAGNNDFSVGTISEIRCSVDSNDYLVQDKAVDYEDYSFEIQILPSQQSSMENCENPDSESNSNTIQDSFSFQCSSSESLQLTPTIRQYIRQRKSFMKLHSPDVATPRRAILNLRYGQEIVKEKNKRIKNLERENRQLRGKIETLNNFIKRLQEQNLITHDESLCFNCKLI